MLNDEYRYRILKLIETNPELSQRQIARELGISLGKANFCLKALINVGLLKVGNFRNSKNKLGYIYLLTPMGIEAKTAVTLRFLRQKSLEHKALLKEIDELSKEAAELQARE